MTYTLSMPEAEAAHLRGVYGRADVILEYGSGGSTELAAQMPDKLVMSVESDRGWARELRAKIAAANPLAQVIIQHVDIGQTGRWGRALDSSRWQNYHSYPNSAWQAPFFRHPDVILIDGRFRTACLMAALLHISRPVTVLFDDYEGRPKYQLVERLVRPNRMVGRMAEFSLEPEAVQGKDMGFLIAQFFEATFAAQGGTSYSVPPDAKALLEQIQSVPQEGPPQ